MKQSHFHIYTHEQAAKLSPKKPFTRLSCSEQEDQCHEFEDFSFFKLLRLVVGSTAGKKSKKSTNMV